MKNHYRIIGQDFNDKNKMGISIRLQDFASGKIFIKAPLELFNDKRTLRRLAPADVLKIGYMVGEYQTALTYQLLNATRLHHEKL